MLAWKIIVVGQFLTGIFCMVMGVNILAQALAVRFYSDRSFMGYTAAIVLIEFLLGVMMFSMAYANLSRAGWL